MKNEPSTFIISIPGSVGTNTHRAAHTRINISAVCVCERGRTQWDTLHHGKILWVARARAASTMVIASNSTSPGIRVYIYFMHSYITRPFNPFKSRRREGWKIHAQKGLIKKNYWELSFWQKHGKGVTCALLFLLFQVRGAVCECGARRGPAPRRDNYHAFIYGINKNGKRERIAAMEFARVFPLCWPQPPPQMQPLRHVSP